MQNLKCAVFIPDPVPFDIEFLLFKKQNKNHAFFMCISRTCTENTH